MINLTDIIIMLLAAAQDDSQTSNCRFSGIRPVPVPYRDGMSLGTCQHTDR